MRSHTELQFKVFYLWDFGVSNRRDPQFGTSFEWDVDLMSGYESEVVPNLAKRPGAEHFFGFKNPGLIGRLGEWRPDALLLFGYKWASHLRVIRWARAHGVPLLFRGDSHLLGRSRPRLHVRLALRILFSRFASFLYVGAANREYFEAFGVPEKKLYFAPHSVNAELFNEKDPGHRAASEKLRAHLEVAPGARIVLFAGKFLAAKQPAELLAAFLSTDAEDAFLVFVGDGPEKARLQAMVADPAAPRGKGRVRFLPFANQSEMPSRYMLADLFVLPSRGVYETWGLAVNEAMQMGVPCLVSDRVGCQRDLVTPGETGWVFASSDAGALGRALSQALTELRSPRRRDEIRRSVELRIAGYSYSRTTEGLLAALAALPE
jgi:glycosyltransferase involved in cell wall biosynthesis